MKTTRFLAIAIVVAAIALVVFTGSSGAASKKTLNWRNKISPDLLDQIDSGAINTMAAQDQDLDVIVQCASASTATQAQIIQGLGGKVKKSYSILNGFSASMSLRALQTLAGRPEFSYVSPDRPLQQLGHLETTTGAAQIRSLVSGVNLDGSGVGIAILDSGIDKTVHDLSYNGNSRISVDAAVSQFTDAKDYSCHGTHVAAIACGTGHVGPGAYTGIAPGAKIINVKVLDRTGKGYTSDLI
ncbi:MAG TPA: S8 family serine peptidase, partial [Blastocatellia bacterium]|nr:S8 family serine peptidase [Blastocatellia bacterium]